MSFHTMPVPLMRAYLAEWSNMTAAGNLSEFNARRGRLMRERDDGLSIS